jgi:bacterioferritin-associated ferredoxin
MEGATGHLRLVWNLRRALASHIDDAASLKVFLTFMIVCSCNVLSDRDVRYAVNTANDAPRNAKQIYDCLGCCAECGRCARTIKTIIDEAYRECALACQAGCPHRRIMDDTQDEPKIRVHSALTSLDLLDG